MLNTNYYYNWFKKVIAIFIELFFVGAVLSTLYVFTYPFDKSIKLYIFIGIVIVFGLIVCFLRKPIKKLINNILIKLEKLDYLKMLLIIIVTMIVLKVVYSIFFYFDPTIGEENDISIYIQLAEKIASGSGIKATTIHHLLGMAYHLSIFKILNIPYHIGIFVIFLFATVVNYSSFNKIIGKNKSFILIMIYILMPSTILLTFCPTHEIYAYFYFSLFIFIFNKLLNSSNKKQIVYSILLTLICVLSCFVNPSGYVLIIVLCLSFILSNMNKLKKISICSIIVISLLGIFGINNSLKLDDTQTSLNTLYILVRGSSVECNGEHVDYYTEQLFDEYMDKNNVEFTWENKEIAMKYYLKEQYIYLFTHPIDTTKLLVHKFYVEWSGDHYSIEMAHTYGKMDDITYYVLLSISTIIYLFILTVGFVYAKKKEDNIEVSNIKLILLGVVAMLLISLVLNKYSVYMTIFIYLISFYRSEFDEK